ncbi:hypothetical protein [Mycobacterium hubeiense]|uniref:hypothetical protein n=1 Tax=Mycobacterium hubeiense TaxID=1867256 RepID=UPI001E49639B|nr:hypothetical protein [Mycobacterium sp. QGD 101]
MIRADSFAREIGCGSDGFDPGALADDGQGGWQAGEVELFGFLLGQDQQPVLQVGGPTGELGGI